MDPTFFAALHEHDAASRLERWMLGPRTNLSCVAIRKAVGLALEAHASQVRANGDPFVGHPLNVARLLARSFAGRATMIAAILHDVVEDCDVTLADIERSQGHEVAQIVELLTKPGCGCEPPILDLLSFAGSSDRGIVARAIYIKLFDRLDNLRTVAALPRWRQLRLAAETLELLCPAADRLRLAVAPPLRALAGVSRR